MAKETKKTAKKPKTMASRRGTVTKTASVFGAIVKTILNTKKKTFTSTEIAKASKASPRHSRRTLASLASKSVLRVKKGEAPFEYSVASRETLKKIVTA
jgi:Fic family protein